MATSPILSERRPVPEAESALPQLQPGDHLDQKTFHKLYEAMPEGFKAELIGGVVFIPSFTVSAAHSDEHSLVAMWLGVYRASTPGTRTHLEGTILLGPDSEPQPDASLLIQPEFGGRTRLEGIYVAGPPELVVEVAYSSHAYDLHSKRRDYEKAGVLEYVVLVLHQGRVEWMVCRDGQFTPHAPNEDGWFRSTTFPGLWLDPAALLRGDAAGVLRALQLGLATPEHAAFVEQLQARRQG